MSQETRGGREESLEKAVENLESAEKRLEVARGEEESAERAVAEAVEEIKEAKRDVVTVNVIHVNEVEKASFPEKLTATLRQVWDKSYVELKIARKPKDVFQTAGEHPKSLMSHLDLTLEQAREKHVIEDFCFGIASETGGA
jgi:exonuclease VII small subunit